MIPIPTLPYQVWFSVDHNLVCNSKYLGAQCWSNFVLIFLCTGVLSCLIFFIVIMLYKIIYNKYFISRAFSYVAMFSLSNMETFLGAKKNADFCAMLVFVCFYIREKLNKHLFSHRLLCYDTLFDPIDLMAKIKHMLKLKIIFQYFNFSYKI